MTLPIIKDEMNSPMGLMAKMNPTIELETFLELAKGG